MNKNFIRIAIFLWAAAVGAGTFWFVDYSSKPATTAIAPGAGDPAVPHSELPVLIVFIHPHCPCSRATLSELERLMARNPGRMEVHAWFYKPDGVDDDWLSSDTRRKAESMPGVEVSTIDDRVLKRFGTVTSGQVLLYDTNGGLVFSGGITIARAMEGDNAGLSSVESFLRSGQATAATAPVFGCILNPPGDS